MSDEVKEIDISTPAFLLREVDIFNAPPFDRVLSQFMRMRANPPQVLLIEGGSQNERLAASIFWACLLNCEAESATNAPRPCLACTACKRFMQATHRDFFVLDGRDESIKIKDVREWVRPVLGEPPREAKKRVVLIAEAQALGIEAANSLLKSLEEPRPQNAFIMTAPQRERLLPTLVSRSWVVTLPWPAPGKSRGLWEEQTFSMEPGLLTGTNNAPEMQEWETALAGFLINGQGWFAKTSSRGSLTQNMALCLLARCQSALAATLMQGKHEAAMSPIYKALAKSNNLLIARRAYEAISACQTALHYNVNPALVMDWLATRLFVWMEELRRQK